MNPSSQSQSFSDTSSEPQAPLAPDERCESPASYPADPSPQPVAEDYSSHGDIDREVEEALAGMSVEDLDALGVAGRHGEAHASTDVRRGRVMAIDGDDVFVETGGRSQGVIPLSQFENPEEAAVGAMVEFMIDRYDDRQGMWILSREGAVQEATWANLVPGAIVEGRVTGMNKGGLEVDLKGIRGFMPASQVDIQRVPDISVLIGEHVRCLVTEAHRAQQNVLLSRRKLMERERKEAREVLLHELAEGQIRKGVVGNVTDFGAFVDLGGVDGLIHVSDMSWSRVDKPSDVCKPGDMVEVKILKYDPGKKKISLGLKQVKPDPWDSVGDHYRVGQRVNGRVMRVMDFGAFVEIEPGIEALVPVGELTWTKRVKHPSEIVRTGQDIEAEVMRVEPEKRRISLSMRQIEEDPWSTVAEEFAANQMVTGKVTRLTEFGAFVELRPGVEGLVHISEMSDKQRVRDAGKVVSVDQEIQVRVLEVDMEKRRISLSLKKHAEASAEDMVAASAGGHQPKKRKKPLRGGLSAHFDWFGDSGAR